MWVKEVVEGYECNLIVGKTGVVRSACVLLGSPDHAGLRAKDAGSRGPRRSARLAVASALSLPLRAVRAQSRFARITSDGSVRDDSGRVVGRVIIL